MGKTIVKYRKDRDYGEDDNGTRNRRGVQDTRVRRKVKYEEIIEQFEDENNFTDPEDDLDS